MTAVADPAPAAPGTASARSLSADYWRQWWASAISNLGDGINFVAMPLLALSLTQDERLIALVTLATFIPWLVIALPVGVVVDRANRQVVMVVANVVRVVLFAAIALAAIAERLEIWHLLVVLLVVGGCEVFFDSSAQAFLPLIVEPHQLARANGLMFAAEVVAGSIAGLSIGAILFDLSTGLPFAANAASFSVAAALIVAIRVVRRAVPAAEPEAPADRNLRSGLRWLLDHPLLRALAVMFTFTNLGLMFGQGIFVKYAVVELGLNNSEFGVLLAITAMGGATGGLIGPNIVHRIGLRGAVFVPYVVFGLGQLIIGLVPPAWVVAATGFAMGLGITVWNVATVTLRQRIIPPERFGRVNGVYRWLGAAASTVGVGAGGWIAYATNLRAPFLLGGAITIAALVVFARPVLAGFASEDASAVS